MNDDHYSDFVIYKFKPIDDKSFQIHCERNVVQKFITRAFEYLKKNSRVEVKRKEFTTEFQIHLFMKLGRGQIELKYPTVGFSVKDGILYSKSKDGDLKDI